MCMYQCECVDGCVSVRECVYLCVSVRESKCMKCVRESVYVYEYVCECVYMCR